MNTQTEQVIEVLRSRFQGKDLLVGAAVAERVTSYWNPGPTIGAATVFPRSTDDVSYILKTCHDHDQAVVVQGGKTGVVQGAEATASDIIISFERMNGVEDIDVTGCTATVQAGAVLEAVQTQIAAQGLLFPLDLGARGSCTIGGNVATNAGGINVIRYGMMRNLVLGLEAVLADGTVLSSMNYMLKNNAGYDLKQLFIGSEGTLGIVTRVVIRLFPAPLTSQSALVAMTDFTAVTDFLRQSSQALGGDLSAYEVMWGDYYRAVTGPDLHRAPLARDHAFYVVLKMEGSDPAGDPARFEGLLADALERGVIADAVVPQSEREELDIWTVREQFEPLFVHAPVFLYDVSLPIKDMAGYVTEVEQRIAAQWPDGMCFALGHIGDGNLHFFVAPKDDTATHAQADEIIYGALVPYSGSVSAEHGIGHEKKGWLSASRTADEIAVMQLLKRTLDPKGILNPGVVL